MATDTTIKQDEKVEIDIKPPHLFKVIMLNDNHTPMDLVVEILVHTFDHSREEAKRITMEIHNSGSGVAGVYNYEVAEEYALEATDIARTNGSPLRIKLEPDL